MTKDDINRKLCEQVAKARTETGLSRKKLAVKVGISENTVCNHETGLTNISAADLYMYAKVLKKPVSWFYGVDDEEAKKNQFLALEKAKREINMLLEKETQNLGV